MTEEPDTMGKCTKCGTNFVGTPENPPPDGLCRYCQIDSLKAENAELRAAIGQADRQLGNGLSVVEELAGKLESAQAELAALRAKNESLQSDRYGDFKLVEALADDAGIKITANSKLPGFQWEQFNHGVMEMKRELAALQEQVRNVVELLRCAKCPNCDGSGSYATHSWTGLDVNCQQCQCQWCDARNAALPLPAPDAKEGLK